jgi:hypothetical protein
MIAATPSATDRATPWAASFWKARRARLMGMLRTISSVPRDASPASVPARAVIDHMPTITGKKPISRQLMKPGIVSMLIGSPTRPWKTTGSSSIWVASWSRSAAVSNWVPTCHAVTAMISPTSAPRPSDAQRASRSDLPKTLPRP